MNGRLSPIPTDGYATPGGDTGPPGRGPGRRRAGRVLVAAVGALTLVLGPATVALGEPPRAIAQKASEGDLKWAPALDYDTDSCYSTPAISPDGVPAEGLSLKEMETLTDGCRDPSDLENTNAYVRTWCQDNGDGTWCAHKYAYYFEVDKGADGAGHRHDFEHAVVWVRNDQVRYVAVSGHGGYEIKDAKDVEFEGNHPKIVYNKDGPFTHRFRHASAADDPPENDRHTWQRPALVGWERMDPRVREILATHDYGSATLALKDSQYAGDLTKSKREQVPWDFGAPLPSTDPPPPPLPPGNPNALLRIMPLGSSSTAGTGSSTGDGYREELRRLTASGLPDLVGSNVSGTMSDRDNEGWPGYRIQEIAGKASCAVRTYQPNVVTVVAGANDVLQDFDMSGAPSRLEVLVRQVLGDDAGVTVLVGGIQPVTTDPAATQRAAQYNTGQQQVVDKLAAEGLRVGYASPGMTTADVGPDRIHPTDTGYAKIAGGFAKAIADAREKSWVMDPRPQAADAGSHPCGPQQDYGNGNGGGTDQGVVDRRWEDHGVSFKDGFGQGKYYQWGDVNKDGKPELFVINPDQSWTFYWNSGRTDKGWTGWDRGVTRPRRAAGLSGSQLRIADIDGDGEPDCLQVGPNGFVDAFLWEDSAAVGQKLCGKVSKVQHDVPGTGAIGAKADTRIVFADVNGDKLDDYLLVQPRGTTFLWLNGGTKPDPDAEGKTVFTWTQVGQIAAPTDPARIRRWADINGDGRADMILITANGGARAWLNDGITKSANAAPTGVRLRDIGEIATDKQVPPADVQFVDVGGDGKADLVRTGWTGVTHIWLNRLNPPYASKPLGS